MQPTHHLTTEDVLIVTQALYAQLNRPASTTVLSKKEHHRLRHIYYHLLLSSGVAIYMNTHAEEQARGMFETWDYTDYPNIVRTKKER